MVQEYRSEPLPPRDQASLQPAIFIPVLPPTLTNISKLITIRYAIQVLFDENVLAIQLNDQPTDKLTDKAIVLQFGSPTHRPSNESAHRRTI